MGKDNICRLVPNEHIKGVVRPACSKCGGIIGDVNATSCPYCHRKFKPSKFARELTEEK